MIYSRPIDLQSREKPKPDFIKNRQPKQKIITNAFAYNPAKVIKGATHQTGEEPKAHRKIPLMAGKRISRTGKVYYETRRNRSSLNGRLQ